MYWLIGQILGQPHEQNVQGTLLYDVRDYGQDVSKGARFSVTNAESTFHTDNSFSHEVSDYVGLLCLNPAKSGGMNMLVSAYAAAAVRAEAASPASRKAAGGRSPASRKAAGGRASTAPPM